MAQEFKQLLLENQLCFPLYACGRKIVNAYTPFLKPLGLTYTQYVVFMVLWEKESVNVGQLGSILHLDAGTLTPLLKHLEKEGYITRNRSKDDERVTVISITSKGNDLKEKCKDIPSKISESGSALTGKEAKELYRLLYKYLDAEQEKR
ncbi:MAG: MarR family transcriptional regulator [Lachnospiraceae bacterium]|nr:MarR family transcriptional regulator [Lachnospiraceae bacterium]